MANESTTPVVLLAFANDRDDYLQMIIRERKAIARALQDADDKGYIKVVKEEIPAVPQVVWRVADCQHLADLVVERADLVCK